MMFTRKSTFGRATINPNEVTGVLKYVLILLFIGFCLGLISFDFYFIEKALYWADPPIVNAKGPAPVSFKPFKLGSRNLFAALLEEGVSRQEANNIINSLKDVDFNFSGLRPKQKVTLRFDASGKLQGFQYQMDTINSYLAKRLKDGTFSSEHRELPTIRKIEVIAGRVETSVWNAIIGLGEKPTVTAKFIEIFGWDIDFSSDARKGDTFVLVLEKIYTENGEMIGYGKLFAGLYNGKHVGEKRGFYVDHPTEKLKGFYTEKGMQMRKFMLRAPLNTLRVTSRFGFRMHPTLHKRKIHNGIDYGAPTGTPIWAVADGKVVRAGRAGAAGNMIVIDHGDGLQSYYMHLSSIHVKAGQSVNQRRLIGRVGSTGRSTGPHLHFGLKHKGKWINPIKRKFGKPIKLDEKYMPLISEASETFGSMLENAWRAIPPLTTSDDDAPPELAEPLS